MRTIGILGGMGSEATSILFQDIVHQTDAANDSEHIPVIINNDPSIPDRSAFILGKGPDPVPYLQEGAKKLQDWGAGCIIIPCNTAHYFIDEINSVIQIPVLNMIEETAVFAKKQYPGVSRFGLLATLGTYKTGLYEKAFSEQGLTAVLPDEHYRNLIMGSIYGKSGLKAGFKSEPAMILKESIQFLQSKGVEIFISGCTEVSLVSEELGKVAPILDPMKILAEASIRFAGGKVSTLTSPFQSNGN